MIIVAHPARGLAWILEPGSHTPLSSEWSGEAVTGGGFGARTGAAARTRGALLCPVQVVGGDLLPSQQVLSFALFKWSVVTSFYLNRWLHGLANQQIGTSMAGPCEAGR